MIPICRMLVLGAVAMAASWSAMADDDLATAELQFDRHNYKAALVAADRYLAEAGADAADVPHARAVRARCLSKLRRWDESIAELKKLFADHPEMAKDPDLHVAMAEPGLQVYRYKAIAIRHLRIAFEQYLAVDDLESAAEAAIQCANAFVHFTEWDKLEGLDFDPPDDWQASRRLQQRFAIEWLDRGIAMTLDPDRAAAAVYRKGTLLYRDLRTDDSDVDKAIEIYRELLRRWPGAKEAPGAALQIARLLERRRQDYVAAVEAYRAVIDRYPTTRSAVRARDMMKNLTTPVVRVGVAGPVPPGAHGAINLEVRNVASVSLSAFRVDLFDLVREVGFPTNLAKWEPRGDRAASWTINVPDTGEHKFYATQKGTLPAVEFPITDPGAYVIIAEADGIAEHPTPSKALMIVSKLAAVTKGSKGGTLAWTTNAITGDPVVGAEILVQEFVQANDFRYRTGRTNDDGLYHAPPGDGRSGGTVSLYARQGDHYAVCNSGYRWWGWNYPEDYRVYTFTDRPVYRPDQAIHFKNVLRRYQAGDYANVPNKPLTLTVYDPAGQVVEERKLTTNAHGSAVGEITLRRSAALGVYRMQIEVDGRHIFPGQGGYFRVEEYRKPEFEVTVGAAEARYDMGKPVEVRIEGRYYFGSPVVDATVAFTVYRAPLRPPVHYPGPYPWYFEQLGAWWARHAVRGLPDFCWYRPPEKKSLVQRGELRTDTEGIALLRIQPDKESGGAAGDTKDFRYIIEVEMTDSSRRTVTGSGHVNVTTAPFTVRLTPQRWLYQPKDNVQIDIEARGPNDEPVEFEGTMRVHRLVRKDKDAASGGRSDALELGELIAEQPVVSDSTGHAFYRFASDQEGPLRFTLIAPSTNGADATGSCDVWITRQGGGLSHYAYRDIELVMDKYVYETGETARVLINTRFDRAAVLVTVEADELLYRRVFYVRNGGTVISLPIESMHVPNFYITATLIRDNKVYQDMKAIVVPPTRRFLTVDVESPSEVFGPGDHAEFVVSTTDADGRNADAEVALMMVDASLYYIQPEFRERVQKFFYGKIRPHMVGTRTSFDLTSGVGGPIGINAPRVADGGARLQFGMMEGRAMAKTAVAESDGPSFATAEIRRDFPDSVLWIGQLSTGEDGRETVDVTMPDSLTTWRLIAVAVDDETRVGETSRDLVTRKDIIARLQTPRFLVERDVCKITVIAHNDLDTSKTARVSLRATGPVELGSAESTSDNTATFDVLVEAGGEVAVDFEVTASHSGSATFTATIATDELADAMQTTIPILAFGAEKLLTRTGVIHDTNSDVSQTVSFTLPDEMNPDTPILEVDINPTIAGVMLDAIPYLLEYPYGCTEQTMSRFLPAVITRQTLENMGVKLKGLAHRAPAGARMARRWRPRNNPVFNDAVLDDIVAVGLGRLAEMQHGDGGWGWWKRSASDPYMSAYVVYGLAEAKHAGVRLDTRMLERGVTFLEKCVVDPACIGRRRFGYDDPNVRMWMLYALSVNDPGGLTDPDIQKAIDRAYEDRDELADYARAMLALVLHGAGDQPRAETIIENLDNTVRVDAATQTASWGDVTGYRRWYRNGLETTAMVLRALLAIAPNHPYIADAANWLVRSRRGARWYSTKDTAFAVYALAEYLEVSGELDADMTVTVTFDDKIKRSFRITPDNLLDFDTKLIFAPRHLTPGKHTIRVDKQGRGHLYHAAYVDFYTKQDPISAAGQEIVVKRTYVRLVPKEVERTRRVWDSTKGAYVEEPYRAIDYDREPITTGQAITTGDLIEVDLEIDARNDFEYIVIEDPKPAGCEPAALRSGRSSDNGLYANVELRDKYVAFFVGYLRQKVHQLTYRLRCETPGAFGALPTRVEAMYSPYVRANSASDRLIIRD